MKGPLLVVKLQLVLDGGKTTICEGSGETSL